MRRLFLSARFGFSFLLTLTLLLAPLSALRAQSGRQQTPPAPGGTQRPQKKNQRPDPNAPPTQDDAPPPEPPKGGFQDDEIVRVTTALVNVEAVVYNKKSKQIVTNLKAGNFKIFEDGQPREISNFATPDAPITVSLVLEFSKLSATIGLYGNGGFENGTSEVLRPAAIFLTQFVRPPNDFVSVIAYDIRPTPITDFTNDPRRIQQTISLLARNNPAFTDSNLFDAVKFTLIGGRGDSVVLEDSEQEKSDYSGLASLTGRRKAMILICTGIDTFSKINYDDARKIAQNAGVPMYIIGTGNLFFKKYEGQLDATDSLTGFPGRMTFYQAQNTLKTFAKETGGAYYPITFEGEIGGTLQAIDAQLRNQYSLGFAPGAPKDGKKHKIEVRVDVNGDGQTDEKEFVVQARQVYVAAKE